MRQLDRTAHEVGIQCLRLVASLEAALSPALSITSWFVSKTRQMIHTGYTTVQAKSDILLLRGRVALALST